MQFEDLEQYLHEEHRRNRELREARRLVEQLDLPQGRSALFRHRLQRALAACLVVGISTSAAAGLMPGPDYDYVCGSNGDCAVCVYNDVQSIYQQL